MAIPAGDLVVAADIGTSSVKVGLVDRALSIVTATKVDLPLSRPGPHRAEQDPESWWSAFALGLRNLLQSDRSLAGRIAGLVFAAQMCGVVATDGDGRPLRPCMVWLDKRAGHLMRASLGGWPEIAGYNAFRLLRSIQLCNGAPSLNGMDPIAKMMWLRQFEPETWARTDKLIDVKDWLVQKATGRLCTTADSAHLTWLLDTRHGQAEWSPELMNRYGIPRSKLPDIVEGTAMAGVLTPKAAGELDLPSGIPVAAGCGDVCAAAIGSGATGDGQLHISLGTSAWISGFFNGRRLNVSDSYATITSPVTNRPLLIATQECAGACLDWLASVTASGEVQDPQQQDALPIFLPWLAGERVPIDDNRLRGTFLGLSLNTRPEDLTLSVMEGVALNLRLAMQSVARQRGAVSTGPIAVVGGAANNDTLCQMLADCLQRPLVRPDFPEFTSLRGATALAATALGWQTSPWSGAGAQAETNDVTFLPQAGTASHYDKRFAMFRHAVRRVVPWYQKFSDGL